MRIEKALKRVPSVEIRQKRPAATLITMDAGSMRVEDHRRYASVMMTPSLLETLRMAG